ncbi:MAG: cell division/cell wall cluster transcriptional repressor MraZ [Lachnospiraceae bacterium]|nr:cell division/cell wall cluster transcriptional repressor MraZ [Lachnospiraceae bacterium]
MNNNKILQNKEYYSYIEENYLYIPPEIQELLGNSFIITHGLDETLWLFKPDAWKRFYDKLRTFPLDNKDTRSFVRFFMVSATELKLESNNRVHLPDYLLRFWGKNFRVVIRNNRRFDPSKGVCLEIVLNMEK